MRIAKVLSSGVATFGLLILAGCVSTYKYVPYVGEQQDCPTSPGSFVESTGPLPIYFSYPPKPYEAIGMIVVNINSINTASRHAKALGGEALLRKGSKTVDGGSVEIPGVHTSNNTGMSSFGNYNGNSTSYSTPSVTVPIRSTFQTFYVIKFKTQPFETASSATNSSASSSQSTKTN